MSSHRVKGTGREGWEIGTIENGWI